MTDGIILQNPCHHPANADRLKRACRAALASQPWDASGSLCIVLSDSRTIRELNLRYAKVDAPTDVLSFRAGAAPQETGEPGRYLGDIVIAYDYAAAQAQAAETALGDVLCLLVIHGTLHLLGYDHDTEANRELMWAAQDQALRALSIDRTIVSRYGKSGHDAAI